MTSDSKRERAPIQVETENASRNDQLHKATKLQSVVTPEQYPETEREAQVEAATGQPGTSAGSDARKR